MMSFLISGSHTDLYEIKMRQTYLLEGRHLQPVFFDYFFRKINNRVAIFLS